MHYDKEEEEKKGRGKNKYKVRALVAMPLTYLQKRKKEEVVALSRVNESYLCVKKRN